MNPSEDFNMKKDTKYLQELLTRISSYLDPTESDDQMKWLHNKKLVERLYGEKPECFVAIKDRGQDISTILPVCNRAGMQDPRIIQFSIKLAKKMGADDKVGLVDPASLSEAVEELEKLKEKVKKKKATPKGAALKANSTKGINKIKDHLKRVRGK
jgi:hypothetical protein